MRPAGCRRPDTASQMRSAAGCPASARARPAQRHGVLTSAPCARSAQVFPRQTYGAKVNTRRIEPGPSGHDAETAGSPEQHDQSRLGDQRLALPARRVRGIGRGAGTPRLEVVEEADHRPAPGADGTGRHPALLPVAHHRPGRRIDRRRRGRADARRPVWHRHAGRRHARAGHAGRARAAGTDRRTGRVRPRQLQGPGTHHDRLRDGLERRLHPVRVQERAEPLPPAARLQGRHLHQDLEWRGRQRGAGPPDVRAGPGAGRFRRPATGPVGAGLRQASSWPAAAVPDKKRRLASGAFLRAESASALAEARFPEQRLVLARLRTPVLARRVDLSTELRGACQGQRGS